MFNAHFGHRLSALPVQGQGTYYEEKEGMKRRHVLWSYRLRKNEHYRSIYLGKIRTYY
jgi:hypothetical protein